MVVAARRAKEEEIGTIKEEIRCEKAVVKDEELANLYERRHWIRVIGL